jgi:hypothetical protein
MSSSGLMEPIEGVSLETYAGIVGRMISGGDLDSLVREAGMDRAKYDRVAEAWNGRMATDETFTVTTAYGQALNAASNAARGTEDGPTISWEKLIEVQEATSELTKVGMDPQTVMEQLGVSLAEYVSAGEYYGKWFHANIDEHPELLDEANEYHEKYRAKYAAAKQDQDLEF